MTERGREYVRAYWDGRNAEVGADNPYRGDMVCARLWRRGYTTSMEKRINGTRAMLRYQAGRDGLAARAPWN
jgi:hypothetical protein